MNPAIDHTRQDAVLYHRAMRERFAFMHDPKENQLLESPQRFTVAIRPIEDGEDHTVSAAQVKGILNDVLTIEDDGGRIEVSKVAIASFKTLERT